MCGLCVTADVTTVYGLCCVFLVGKWSRGESAIDWTALQGLKVLVEGTLLKLLPQLMLHSLLAQLNCCMCGGHLFLVHI